MTQPERRPYRSNDNSEVLIQSIGSPSLAHRLVTSAEILRRCDGIVTDAYCRRMRDDIAAFTAERLEHAVAIRVGQMAEDFELELAEEAAGLVRLVGSESPGRYLVAVRCSDDADTWTLVAMRRTPIGSMADIRGIYPSFDAVVRGAQ